MAPAENGFLCVTGATGFLGGEIVRRAADAGLAVSAGGRSARCGCSAARYVRADVLDPPALAALMDGARTVIHAAGLAHGAAAASARRSHQVNGVGTRNVAQAALAAGAGHFVLVSTVAVYGGSRGGGGEDTGCLPQGTYAESKYEAESCAIEIAGRGGMALTILRLATLYGEGDPGSVGRLMAAIDHGRFIRVGRCANRKSLLHRDDAARACLAVASRPAAGIAVYNVTGPPLPMRSIVDELAMALARDIPRFAVPAFPARALAAMLSRLPAVRLRVLGDSLRKWLADDAYDGSRFARCFGFRPEVPLADGLRRQVAWYRGQGAKP